VSEFATVTLGLVAAVAPFGALPVFIDARAEGANQHRIILGMCVAAFLLMGVAVLAAGPFLEWLDVSPENFQLAAGLIMLPQALQLLVRGRTLAHEGSGGLLPLAVPLLAGPASVVAAMSYGARFGEGRAAGASALVLFATAGLLMAGERFPRWVGRAGMGALGRFNGALLVVVAVELIVDGVRSV
jgi:small neutral amino acid transporter SnatA (MarC family)